MQHFGKLEKRLWESADLLRANSNFASNEYFMPIMGLIFLRHAYSRFLKVKVDIEANLPSRGGKTRALTKEDFSARSAIFLKPEAQFDHLVALPEGEDKGAAIVAAMESIEADYDTLSGVLPKTEYNELENDDLSQILRIFDDPELKKADGDVFGRIYEYFLTKFADQKAHDNGEFFTPISIVQTIVNVIEPSSGKILDPACGSGGMFVQSAHFIENMKANPSERVTFYGMEKNPTTLRLAKMNLAVHGLEGDIQKAISYYEDPHKLLGQADYVMANPPFNVDEIDAEKIKGDPRLPFGLPGVNKKGKVSNGNYVWMSFFHAYLSEKGRAGIVMSSQASSAGKSEMIVREQLVKSGDVDIMIAIRGNFFYTRSVPCELWFFDKDKPDNMQDKVLMIDARQIYRVLSRKVYDFSPEQMQNINAVVWLYRGQTERFLSLIENYQKNALIHYETELYNTLAEYVNALTFPAKYIPITKHKGAAFGEICGAFTDKCDAISKVMSFPIVEIETALANHTVMIKLSEQVPSIIKMGNGLFKEVSEKADAIAPEAGVDVDLKKLAALKDKFNAEMKRLAYLIRQSDWLLSRFPEGKLVDVEGLVKLVDHAEIEENDWSLTPGRYVGVAPEEEDLDFDFDEVMQNIQFELTKLNSDAVSLAALIQSNFENLA